MAIIYSKEQDGTMNVLISGRVSREPQAVSNDRGGKVKFSVNYGKSKYMDCEVWSDREDVYDVACRLEKGDSLAVMGQHRAWVYNDKNYQAVTADAIFTLNVPLVPVANAPASANAPAPSGNSFYEELDDDEELPF